MTRLFFSWLLLLVVHCTCVAQSRPISKLADYKRSVSHKPGKQLVDLDTFIPGIRLDIRYAQQ